MKMSADQILELEVSLLLMKYGFDDVYGALNRLSAEGDKSVESRLENLRKTRKKGSVKKTANRVEKIIEDVRLNSSEKAEILSVLHERFLKKTFLRNMTEVRRFLSRRSSEPHSLKSREEARFR